MQRAIFVPPGGFVGAAQMTQAGQLAYGGRNGGMRLRRKKRRAKTAKRRGAKRTHKRASRRVKLRKGSAAAKRFMARLRAKRRK